MYTPSDKEKIIKSISFFIFISIIGALTVFYVWNTLMVPIFGLKLLSVPEAYGVRLVVSYFKLNFEDIESIPYFKLEETAIQYFGVSLTTAFLAYVVSNFI